MSSDSYFIDFTGMKYFDGCSRFINRTISHSIEEGIQAKWKNPLWAPSRQWTLGKFRAISGGSIVRADVSTRTKDIDSINLSEDDSFQELSNIELPLEPLVEQEQGNVPDISARPKAWNSEKLEYSFAIKAGNTTLKAEEVFGDQLDWYDFNLDSELSFDGRREKYSLMPAHITFQGGTDAGFWTIEEGNVNLGNTKRPNLNFLSMLLIEFAMIYANDWFIIPLQQKIGSLRGIDNLTVIDTFGIFEKINPIIDATEERHLWSIFTLSGSNGYGSADAQILFLPNTVMHNLKGDDIEKISISRDELANLVWAIEHKYLSKDGTVVNRDDVEASNIPDPPAIEKNPLYRLKSHLPLNWIPYVPIQKVQEGDIILRRGRTDEKASSDPTSYSTQYKGQLIREAKKVNEEEVPAMTIQLTRKYKLIAFGPEEWKLQWDEDISKWKLQKVKSKEIYVWIGRNKKPGLKNGYSNLQHDYLIDK